VLLKLNKLTRPVIALTLAVVTPTTKKIIEEAGRRRGVKLLQDISVFAPSSILSLLRLRMVVANSSPSLPVRYLSGSTAD
jgi:hypothetical protein